MNKIYSNKKILILLIFFAIQTFVLNAYASADDNAPGSAGGDVQEGKKVYIKYCSVCHGIKGEGDGQGSYISAVLPTNLTNKAYMSLFSDDDLVERISAGEDGFPYLQMDGLDNQLSKSTIRKIVSYIRTMAKDTGPLNLPTPEERIEKFKEPLERGRIYYLRYCATCHGVSGDGKGWAARTIDGTPAAHNNPVVMVNFTRQDIFNHVKGLREKNDRKMPVFGKTFKPEVIKEISAYTKTLSENIKE